MVGVPPDEPAVVPPDSDVPPVDVPRLSRDPLTP